MKVTALETFKAKKLTFQKGYSLTPEEINLIIDVLQRLIIGKLVSVEGDALPLPDEMLDSQDDLNEKNEKKVSLNDHDVIGREIVKSSKKKK